MYIDDENIFCYKISQNIDVINCILSYLIGYDYVDLECNKCLICCNKTIYKINSLSEFLLYSRYLCKINENIFDVKKLNLYNYIDCNLCNLCNLCDLCKSNKSNKKKYIKFDDEIYTKYEPYYIELTLCQSCKYSMYDPYMIPLIDPRNIFLTNVYKISKKILLIKHINYHTNIIIFLYSLCLIYYLLVLFDIIYHLGKMEYIKMMAFWYVLFGLLLMPLMSHLRAREKYLQKNKIALYCDNLIDHIDYSIDFCIV